MTIYLNYDATTPQDPAVIRYISDICQDTFGRYSKIAEIDYLMEIKKRIII